MMDLAAMPTAQVIGKHRSVRAKQNAEDDIVVELMSASKSTLVKTANGIVDEKVKDSNIFDSTVEDRVPRFSKEELRLGKILGRGGFCMVMAIDKVKIAGLKHQGSSVGSNAFVGLFKRNPNTQDDDNSSSGAESRSNCAGSEGPNGGHDRCSKRSVYSAGDLTRSNIAKLAKKRSRKGGLFVLKQVMPDSHDNFNYLKGLVDLSMEAKFLASLDHPNIITLCGMSSKGPAHFIIIERLQETLTSRFKTWMKIDRQCKGITGVFTGSKRKVVELYEDRIGVAFNVARALAYLHEKNIIFRDLKPDNCGFDSKDQLKLFDFGLAKELKQKELIGDGLYNLTGMTGAIRYMAPEVGLGKPYNLSADVYSWSMLMWFILALEPPFGFYTEDMIRDRVFKRGSRPAIFDNWSSTLGDTMKRAWGEDIASRPTFHEICPILNMELSGSTREATNTTSESSFRG